MKNIISKFHTLVIFSGIVLLGLTTSCDDFEDDRLDFSETFPAYVEFSTGSDLEISQDTTVTIAIRIPPTIYQDVSVEYAVTGVFSTSGTGSVASGVLNGSLNLSIPADIVPAGEESAEAIITLTSATGGIVIGRNGQGNISRTIIISP